MSISDVEVIGFIIIWSYSQKNMWITRCVLKQQLDSSRNLFVLTAETRVRSWHLKWLKLSELYANDVKGSQNLSYKLDCCALHHCWVLCWQTPHCIWDSDLWMRQSLRNCVLLFGDGKLKQTIGKQWSGIHLIHIIVWLIIVNTNNPLTSTPPIRYNSQQLPWDFLMESILEEGDCPI